MTWQSTAPAALDALVALAEQLKGEKTAIYDGPEVRGTRKAEALIIGYETDRTPAVEHQFTEDGLTANARERYRVNCRIEVAQGSAKRLSNARARAYAILTAYADLINADETLGVDRLMNAMIGMVEYSPSQSSGGAVATVDFAVDCDGYTGE